MGRCTRIAILFLILVVAATAEPAIAQSDPPTENEIRIHFSLYYENFRTNQFEAALPDLKWMIENAPHFPRPDDTNFERLIETYVELAEGAEDPATSAAYLDSAFVWYDEGVARMEELGFEFNPVQWKLRKGRFVQGHAQVLGDDVPRNTEIYLEAFDMGGCEIDPYYVRLIMEDFVGRGERQAALEMTDRAEACYADHEDMMANITHVRNNLFTSPEERMTFLETRLEQNPEDLEIASELFDIYLDLQYREEAAAMGDRLLEFEESASTLRRLGELHLDDGNTALAVDYYERALALPGASDDVRRDILYDLGLARQQDGALAEARSHFRQAIEIDPAYGRAYIAIGDLYATAVSECGTFEREDQAVYWLAVDYYQRAKANDPSISAQADQKISTYRQSFPNQEALFFNEWEPGDAYQINYGCYTWINETTTVKQPA